MLVESPAFVHEQKIPSRYTCEGENLSPPLTLLNVPHETVSLVIIVDDPDAPHGVFNHWIIWNIAPHQHQLPEGFHSSTAKEGVTGFGKIGYHGPCPPPGKPHRYFFKVFALNSLLHIESGATKQEVEKAMQHHLIDQAELMGTYSRTN